MKLGKVMEIVEAFEHSSSSKTRVHGAAKQISIRKMIVKEI
jgi:hypothetical protein